MSDKEKPKIWYAIHITDLEKTDHLSAWDHKRGVPKLGKYAKCTELVYKKAYDEIENENAKLTNKLDAKDQLIARQREALAGKDKRIAELEASLREITSEWESACERADYKHELIDELVASRKAIEVLSNGLFQVSESSIYNYVGIAKRSYKKAKDILGEEK